MKSTSKKVYEALTGHVETRSKYKWVIVWVEGLSYRTGEKIKSIDRHGNITYTTKLTDAMRIESDHLMNFKRRLLQCKIHGTFHAVTYAPKGTIYLKDKQTYAL